MTDNIKVIGLRQNNTMTKNSLRNLSGTLQQKIRLKNVPNIEELF